MPLIRGENPPGSFYGEVSGIFKGSYQFVISGGKKYIGEFGIGLEEGPPLPLRKGRLFDLRKDPQERQNLYRIGDPLTTRYRQHLKERRNVVLQRGRLTGKGQVEFDPQTVERLKSLGYIGD